MTTANKYISKYVSKWGAVMPYRFGRGVQTYGRRFTQYARETVQAVDYNEALYRQRKAEGASASELVDISITNQRVIHEFKKTAEVVRLRYRQRRVLRPRVVQRVVRPRARGIRARASRSAQDSSGGDSDGDGDPAPRRDLQVVLGGGAA